MSTRITSKGQVTIPIEVRAAARAAPGTELEWSYDPVGQRIIATKAGAPVRRTRGRFARLRGSASGGLSTEQIMQLTRDPEAE